MRKNEFLAVKAKFENEKNEILKEIAELQKRRQINIEKIEREKKKLYLFDDHFKRVEVVKASMLQHGYNHQIVQQTEKEVKKIEEYVAMQNQELLKIEEKEKMIESRFRNKLKEIDDKRRKKEEEDLFELKHIEKD